MRKEYDFSRGKQGPAVKSSGKTKVLSLLDKLPADCTLEAIQYHLYVLGKVYRGIDWLAKQGEISHRMLKNDPVNEPSGGVVMKMHNPPHPGEMLQELWMKPLEISAAQAAEALDVTHEALSAILDGHVGISPEMAVRLSLAFGTSAESWLNQQAQYDLWEAEKKRKTLKVKKLSAA